METVVTEIALGVVKWLVDKARHHDTKPDEAALKEIAKQSALALVQRAELELRVRGVDLSTDALTAAVSTMLAAIRKADASGGMLGKLLDGVDVQEMPADWHPPKDGEVIVPTDPDEIPTKPGGTP